MSTREEELRRLAQAIPDKKEPGEWPNNFVEDPDCAGLGTYFCPQCGFGKPENADDTI